MLEALANFLFSTPIWLIGIILLTAMTGAALIGRSKRARHERLAAAERAAGGDSSNEKDDAGTTLTSVLGLLALLLGFTFALAVDRFDSRRVLVLEESNAIGTAWLRTQLLEEPHRATISKILADYTDNRIVLAERPTQEKLDRNDALVVDLWTATMAAFPTIRSIDFSSAYVDSINKVIDLDAARKAARAARVPSEVFLVLLIYMTAASGMLGYSLSGRRSLPSTLGLIALFSVALLLTVDIDRPTDGGIVESQAVMVQLQKAMKVSYPPSAPPPN